MDRPAGCERTYTFRLTEAPGQPDAAWRRRLWLTHEAVNAGSRLFGDWLLTLRGGLCHSLAETTKGRGRARNHDDAKPIRRRRVLLALSWLSVESRHGAPLEFAVASTPSHTPRTLAALADILEKRGLAAPVIEQWLQDCRAALESPIRDDAVWINRSAAFDVLAAGQNQATARADCRQVLWSLFTDQYLVLPHEAGSARPAEAGAAPADQPTLLASSSGAGQRTRHLFSHLFGSSATFGTQSNKLRLRSFWKMHLTAEIARLGMPLDEVAKRGRKHLNDIRRSPSEFHREMFAKAATRVAQVVTKIKRQESRRLHWVEADQKLHQLEVQFPVALGCLDQYRKTNPGASIDSEALSSCREILLRMANARPLVAQKTLASAPLSGAGSAEWKDDGAGDDLTNAPAAYEEFNVFWFAGGNANREKLKAYSEGTAARAGVSKLKAVSYRHPDPYFSPVFCQFGVSRPQIEFSRLNGDAGPNRESDHRTVKMLQWDGSQATLQPLGARSRRFDAEIGAASQAATTALPHVDVARRTRLAAGAAGGAASGDSDVAPLVRVAHVFDSAPVVTRRQSQRKTPVVARANAPRWNGTLRADRVSLAKLGRAAARNPRRAAQLIESNLEWWLSVSIELLPCGPWIDYGTRHDLHDTRFESPAGQRRIVTSSASKQQQWRGLTYPFWHPANRNTSRKGKAKQLLSRLPDLRLLAVVPGYEHGAACAVWQTLSAAQFQDECRQIAQQGGAVDIQPLWATARTAELPSDGVKGSAGSRTICYRRIGPDTLDHGAPHPSCWARLERQFLVKLPGELHDCRRPTSEELAAVEQLKLELGIQHPRTTSNRSKSVNALQLEALRLIAQGLRRHEVFARISRALAGDSARASSPMAVAQGGSADEIGQAIRQWHTIAFSAAWPDAWARELWRHHIAKLVAGGTPDGEASLVHAAAADSAVGSETRPTRLECQEIGRRLSLLDRVVLSQKWAAQWTANDGRAAHAPAVSVLAHSDVAGQVRAIPATGWHARMRWIHDWLRGRKAGHAARGTGGLSLTRIAALQAVRDQVRAFQCRLRPDGSEVRGRSLVATRTARILDLKLEERAKLLASRIVEAAMGLGSAALPDGRRAQMAAAASCHAIVLGTSSNPYELPSGLAPEERVALGRSHRLLRGRLIEACELHGIHLTGYPTRYLAQQDARSGAPGIRYNEVARAAFLSEHGPWPLELAQARERIQAACQAKRPAELSDLFLLVLHQAASRQDAGTPRSDVVRVPSQQGRLLMSIDERSSALRGTSADFNTAANLGLQPLLDTDWPGSWSYLPTIAGIDSGRKPDPERCQGAACVESWRLQPLGEGSFAASGNADSWGAGLVGQPLEAEMRRRFMAELGLLGEDSEPHALAASAGTESVPGAPAVSCAPRKRGRPRKAPQPHQQPYMNLWRDVSPATLDRGVWRAQSHYNRFVLARALNLWLKSDPVFEYTPSIGGQFVLR
jgi:hypothetical protein